MPTLLPESAGLLPIGQYDMPGSIVKLLQADNQLHRTVEADDGARNVTFAYLLDNAPQDEYTDYHGRYEDAAWPEIQAHYSMPYPYYRASMTNRSAYTVDLRLMDPTANSNPGEEGYTYSVNTARFTVSQHAVDLKHLNHFIFDPARPDGRLVRQAIEPRLLLQGIVRSLRILEATYPAGMHGFWDVT